MSAPAGALPADASSGGVPWGGAASSGLVDLSASALSAAIRARRVSCSEVMAAHLGRIEALDPASNAIVSQRRPPPCATRA